MQLDLTTDIDVRGDEAFFIDRFHFNGGEVDEEVKNKMKQIGLYEEPIFFRIISNGEEESSHGWIQKGEIIQWG